MRKSSFIKHIDQLGEEDLRAELLMLFGKVKEVSEFYKMELGTEVDRKRLYDKAKKNITSKFATKSYRRPRRPRVQKVYQILNDTKSKSLLDYEMIDVYLFTCETAVHFADEYEFASTPLFNIIQKTYDWAISLVKLNNMEADYKDRCTVLTKKVLFDRELSKQIRVSYKSVYSDDSQ